MAHFLRGKQAGVQNDLSAGLDPELFAVDDVRLRTPANPGQCPVAWNWQLTIDSLLDME